MYDMQKASHLVLIAFVCLLVVPKFAPAQQSSLKFTVPAGWIEEERTSAMRIAQYRLPKVEPDAEDALVVLYYFGPGQGGSAAANIERWISQMKQEDGSASRDKAKEENLEVNGLKVTTLDLSGTYVAETTPGSGELLNKPAYRLRGAVIETPNGPYFLKLVGPEKTVTHWNESFLSYVRSFEFRS
jgi:hypothetical protein